MVAPSNHQSCAAAATAHEQRQPQATTSQQRRRQGMGGRLAAVGAAVMLGCLSLAQGQKMAPPNRCVFILGEVSNVGKKRGEEEGEVAAR
jgi:hypothetical protein